MDHSLLKKIIYNLIKKIAINLGLFIKHMKIGMNPHEDLGWCYKKFIDEELNDCYKNFKKYFYDSVFLSTEDIRKYSLSKSIKNAQKSGLFLEFGVYKGESFKLFHSLLKKNNLQNNLYGFDSFLGLVNDMKGHSLFENNFNLNGENPLNKNKKIIEGNIEDTLKIFLKENLNLINFIHIDTDTYETCKFILENTKNKMAKNSVILFDEIYNFSGWKVGEYKALKEIYRDDEYKFIAFGKGNIRQEAAIMIL